MTRNNKAQMTVFLILFSLIMSVGLVSAFYKILAFENRAKNMMDASIDAQYFKKDYMLAMKMPVQNITICHSTILQEDCAVYVEMPIEGEMYYGAFKYPKISVEIKDPAANISAKLGLETLDVTTTMILPGDKQRMAIPEMRSMLGCGTRSFYKYCKYSCKSPIQITKTREYNTTYGIMVDRMNITQFMGDKCLA
jgi:hypothetical protein